MTPAPRIIRETYLGRSGGQVLPTKRKKQLLQVGSVVLLAAQVLHLSFYLSAGWKQIV